MRKILTGAFVLAMAATVQIGASAVDASAATTSNSIADTAVTIDYQNQTLTVKDALTNDLEIGFGIATVKLAKDKSVESITSPKDTAWEWYDNSSTGVVIDLSTLSSAKDNYIQIIGDKKTEPLTIKIPAVKTAVKGAYDGATGTVTVTDSTDKANPVEITGLEYRTQYSGWAAYTAGTTSLSKYAYRGAALTFRQAASASELISKTTKATIADTTVYTTKTFPGKEVKVSIAKLANGPKVTADYVNGVFKLPANCQYRITKSTDKALGAWTNGEAKASTLETDITVAGTIEVRTAADSVKKKAASKVGKLAYVAQDKVTVAGKVGSTNVTSGTAANNTKLLTNDISANKADTDVTCAYDAKKTGVMITNNTSAAYQVVVMSADVTTAPEAKVKGIAVAAGKTVTVKAAAGQQLYIRKAGDAKTGVWSTAYIGLGTVKFPTE